MHIFDKLKEEKVINFSAIKDDLDLRIGISKAGVRVA